MVGGFRLWHIKTIARAAYLKTYLNDESVFISLPLRIQLKWEYRNTYAF